MEENPVNDQTESINDESEKEQVVNPESVLAKNRELLGKQRELKDRLAELEAQKSLMEQSKLEAAGKKDELIESLRKTLRDEQDARKKERNSYAYSVVSSKVREEAAKQGCVDGSAFIKLLEKDDFNALEIGDNYNVNSDDLKRLVESKRDSLSFLFKKNVPPTSDVAPGRVENYETKPRDAAELSDEELEAQIRRLDAEERAAR